MDRKIMLNQLNIESIKKTMLTHEDIFQHQVRELHRLYSVQKMLMNEMRNKKIKQDTYWGVPIPRTGSDCINFSNLLINLHHPTTIIGGTEHNKIHVQKLTTVLTDKPERSSGSCCGETPRMPKAFDLDLDLERPAQEEEEEDNISSSTTVVVEDQGAMPKIFRGLALKNNNNLINIVGKEVGYDDESEVELTLSIGGSCFRGKKNKSKCHQ